MRHHPLLALAVAAVLAALLAPLGGAADPSAGAAIRGAHARARVEAGLDARLATVATAANPTARAAAARAPASPPVGRACG